MINLSKSIKNLNQAIEDRLREMKGLKISFLLLNIHLLEKLLWHYKILKVLDLVRRLMMRSRLPILSAQSKIMRIMLRRQEHLTLSRPKDRELIG